MPLLTTPFLTNIDTRAEVKGSRDPLGAQAVWTRFGRHVVRNLTTVSTSLRDFTITLLGYHFANELAEDLGAGSELATFLKWEQLAGYARFSVLKAGGFRGVQRVQANLAEKKVVPISEDRSAQILSNQKIYGLWGLYTSPARESGLLTNEDPPRLSPPAREVVERLYLPRLAGGKRILHLLRDRRARIEPAGADKTLLQQIAKVLVPELTNAERDLYRTHLLYGGAAATTEERVQTLMATLLRDTASADFKLSPKALADLRQSAREHGDVGELLAKRLARIDTCESVLAPCAHLFGHLLCRDGERVDAVANTLRSTWGDRAPRVDPDAFEALGSELALIDADLGRGWVQIARSLATGAYVDTVQLLADQNRQVMKLRGAGAAWLEIRNAKLVVRFRDEQASLPERSEFATLWRFPYFLDSLRAMTTAVEGAAHAS